MPSTGMSLVCLLCRSWTRTVSGTAAFHGFWHKAKSSFLKFAIRKSIDFPVVNCAVMAGGGEPRICLNAVAPKPYRAAKAEAAIAGKPINEANAAAAGEAAVEDATPLDATKYKVQIAKTLVKRALLAL